MESLGITLEEVRARVVRIAGQGDEIVTGQIPFTPRAKKVLELALREALPLGRDYIGTEPLLLGLVRETELTHSSGRWRGVAGSRKQRLKDRLTELLTPRVASGILDWRLDPAGSR
jgi:ATP-dependent Clp protease ATP-binding subunit ClpA